ncbi:MAG: DUF2299 family protein [Patescibacteria group bacterium]|nr:DUF2299 family protein [Patescibacteria group bacterium]
MLQNEKLKSDIKTWLTEDEIKASDAAAKFTDFHLQLSNAFGLGLEVDISKLKGKSIIVFGTKLRNSPSIQQAFMALAEEEKIKVLEELKRDLIRLGVEYNISGEFSDIVIVREIYIEDLTRTSFMDSLKIVRNATIFVISILSEKLAIKQVPTPPHSHSDLPSPYG